jgi:hypothetical protein
MKSSRRRHLLIISALAVCAAGATSCEYDDDDVCHLDDDDFDDDFDDDDFDDDDFDDDGCSIVIIAQSGGGGAVVLVTDHPRPGLQSAHVTISGVSLEGNEGEPQPLYRWAAGHRVDLLSLRGTPDTRVHDVVAARGGIRPAAYTSIRFTVRDPSFVLSSGEAIAPADIDLAAGGNMVVEFARPLLLGPAEVVYIVLDFDLERSFSEVEGGGPRWRLRPIVLVDVFREDVGRGVRAPTDLTGVASSVDREGERFRLELSEGRGILEVRLARSALVRNGSLDLGGAGGIRTGARVVARGSWMDDGALLAEAIILGETFHASGLVREVVPAAGGCLDARVLVTAGQAHEGELHVEACPRTIVSLDRIGPAGPGDLREGMVVAILARTEGGSAAAAAVIDVKQGPTVLSVPGPDAEGAGDRGLGGSVIAVDEADGVVAIASGADLHEIKMAGAMIVLVEESRGSLRQRLIPIQDLEEGMHLEAAGGTMEPGRLLVATRPDPRAER